MGKKAARQGYHQAPEPKRPPKNLRSTLQSKRERTIAAELVPTNAAIAAIAVMAINAMTPKKPVKKPIPHRPASIARKKTEIAEVINAVEVSAKAAILTAAMMMAVSFAMTETAATKNKTRFFLAENPTDSTIMQTSMHPLFG